MPMHPDLQSSLICEDVRFEHNGKLMLIGLFDVLPLQKVPARLGRLCLVTRWCSGEGEFTQEAKLFKPDQSTLLVTGKKMAVKLQNPQSAATIVQVFGNVALEEFGTYWVEVYLDDDLKIRYPLLVTPAPKQPPPKQPPGTSRPPVV